MSQIKNICKKYNIDPNSEIVKDLKDLLKNNMGYFQKFAQWYFKNEVTIGDLRSLLYSLQNIKIKDNINSFDTIDEVENHLGNIFIKRRLNQIIKSIPSVARKNVDQKIINLIKENIDKEYYIKDFLSKKGGRYKYSNDLYNALSEVINYSNENTNYKSILKKIEKVLYGKNLLTSILKINDNQGEIIYKDGKIIIVRVDNYSACSKLGSRHWCIVTSKVQFLNYTANARQYIVFNTHLNKKDPKSLIGITMQKDAFGRVTASHDRSDKSLWNNVISEYLMLIKKDYKNVNYNVNDLISSNIFNLDMFYHSTNWELVIKSSYNNSRLNEYLKSMVMRIIKNQNEYELHKEVIYHYGILYNFKLFKKLSIYVDINKLFKELKEDCDPLFLSNLLYNDILGKITNDIEYKYGEYRVDVEHIIPKNILNFIKENNPKKEEKVDFLISLKNMDPRYVLEKLKNLIEK
jgi:hypothetical protein